MTQGLVKPFLAIIAAACIVDGASATSVKCMVADPELQGFYVGGCDSAGLANGEGIARGVAEYVGHFKAGKKHGQGTKTWPTGDRYAGEFFEDHKQGHGVYVWGGKSLWAGERYTGQYYADKRNGQGVYEWPTGDRYEGPWQDDQMTGPPTPMRILQAQHRRAVIEAVAKVGVKVCREEMIGISGKEYIAGKVTAVTGDRIGVDVLSVGDNRKAINGLDVFPGMVIWDDAYNWLPCY